MRFVGKSRDSDVALPNWELTGGKAFSNWQRCMNRGPVHLQTENSMTIFTVTPIDYRLTKITNDPNLGKEKASSSSLVRRFISSGN
jgi:hypothetical protein